MSLQVGVLRILASHSDGQATTQSIASDLTLLASAEWNARLARYSQHTGNLNIMAASLVTLDQSSWRITAEGRSYLSELEDRVIS